MSERLDEYFLSEEEKIVKVIEDHGGSISICLPDAENNCMKLFGLGWKEFQRARLKIYKEGLPRFLLPRSLTTFTKYHQGHCFECGRDEHCDARCRCLNCRIRESRAGHFDAKFMIRRLNKERIRPQGLSRELGRSSFPLNSQLKELI